MLLLALALNAGLLCLLIFAVARNEGDYSFPRVLLISLGMAMVGTVAGAFGGPWLAQLAVSGGTVWALRQFCYLSWKKSALVTALYLAARFALGFALSALSR